MWTVAGLNLPLIRCSEPLCHYCLFRYCRRKVLTSCVFFFLWFFFLTPFFWGERVVCIVYPVGSEYSKKVHRRKRSSTVQPGFFLDDCRAAGILLLLHVCSRTRTITAVIPDFFSMLPVIWRKGEKLDDRCCYKNRIRKISGVISDFVQCSLWSGGKKRAVPSFFQEQDREDICRCDFRLCSIFPVIWRKGEIWSIVVPRTGPGRYSQVRFPTLWNAPYDLRESRKLDDCCCKKRIGGLNSLPSREEYIRSSTERFAAICCLKKLGFVLFKLGRSVQAFVSQIGKFVRFWAQTDLRNRFCDSGWFTRWFWGWRCNTGIISILVPLRSRRTPGRGRRRVKAPNLRGALLWIQRWSERSALQLTRCSQWKGRWNRPWETVAGGWKRSTSERVTAGGDFCKPADARGGGGGGQDLRNTFQGRISTTLCLNVIKKSSRSAAGPWRAARGLHGEQN